MSAGRDAAPTTTRPAIRWVVEDPTGRQVCCTAAAWERHIVPRRSDLISSREEWAAFESDVRGGIRDPRLSHYLPKSHAYRAGWAYYGCATVPRYPGYMVRATVRRTSSTSSSDYLVSAVLTAQVHPAGRRRETAIEVDVRREWAREGEHFRIIHLCGTPLTRSGPRLSAGDRAKLEQYRDMLVRQLGEQHS